MYTFSAPDSDDDNLSGGAIAGIVIGVVVFAILVCILLYLVFKCIKGDGSQSGLNTSILGYKKIIYIYLYPIFTQKVGEQSQVGSFKIEINLFCSFISIFKHPNLRLSSN